jgi:hypothetical protein
MARPATGNVVTRELANGGTRYGIRFRAQGERIYETLGTDAEGWDRKRAQNALDDRLAEVRLGTYIAPHRGGTVPQDAAVPTFHQFASAWYAQVKPELRESTADAIHWRLSYVLLPFFQHHRLSDITIAEVDRYRAAKVHERDQLRAAKERGEEIDRRRLSNGTINRTIGLLAQILDVAVEYGHIPANPARGKRRKLKASRPQRAYLDSAAQIAALLDAAAELDAHARGDRQHVNRRGQLATPDFLRAQDLGVPCAAVGRRGLGERLDHRPEVQDRRGAPEGEGSPGVAGRAARTQAARREPRCLRVRDGAGQAAESVEYSRASNRQGG